MYPPDLPGIEDLKDQPEIMCRGGSAIISPMGETLAGPLYDQEGILLADLDLSQVCFVDVGAQPCLFQVSYGDHRRSGDCIFTCFHIFLDNNSR